MVPVGYVVTLTILISFTRITELRRDLQAKIGTMTKTGINIGPTIENYGGETFLSQEVTISLLQESKNAFKRCHVVSNALSYI